MALLYNDFLERLDIYKDPQYDSSRFDRIKEISGDCEFEGMFIPISKISSIKRFYESTNDFNRSKIANLININIENIEKAYEIVVLYEKFKSEQY